VRGGTPPRPAPPLSLFDFPLGLALLQQTQSYDPAEFEALAAAYEGLAWRVVSKPGGATVKPDEFYTLYALRFFFFLLPEKEEGWADGCARLESSLCPLSLTSTPTPTPTHTYSLHQQATVGDVVGDRPMWAERGGLDFDGRARWDAWAARRNGLPERARAEFVRAFWEASPKAFYSDGRAAFVQKKA